MYYLTEFMICDKDGSGTMSEDECAEVRLAICVTVNLWLDTAVLDTSLIRTRAAAATANRFANRRPALTMEWGREAGSLQPFWSQRPRGTGVQESLRKSWYLYSLTPLNLSPKAGDLVLLVRLVARSAFARGLAIEGSELPAFQAGVTPFPARDALKSSLQGSIKMSANKSLLK